ncbi:MAG: endonuclease/exonuclease/phosphatase family protein [Planctomycetota bacterium]
MLLTAVVGGGYAALKGALPPQLQQAVGSAGSILQGAVNGSGTSYPGQPTFGAGAPLPGQPAQQPGSATPGYAPAPAAPGSTIRIATFNIQIFGSTKAKKVNVMQALAAIVQHFDIVAIQEIRTQDDYLIDNFLRNYVNATGRRYSRIVGPRLGRSVSKEQYAFLFDTQTIQVNPNLIYTVNDQESDLLHREPLVAMFATRSASPFTFILVNTHTDPDEVPQELDALAQVLSVVKRYGPGEDDVILLGDLNTKVPISAPTNGFQGALGGRQLQPTDLYALGKIPGIYPVIRGEPTNTRRSYLHDNILLHRGATTEFTGQAGVLDLEQRLGITRENALAISDHLPVWAEFSAVEGATPGRMARAPQTPRR